MSILLADDPKLGKHLVFDQDFTKLKDIDEKVWLFNDGPVYNNEKQKYTKKPAKNAWIENGRLIIEARKENGVITSGRLESHGSWKYGYIEIIAKVPRGRGTWPAAWMLATTIKESDPAKAKPWPDCGEIDIMENVGFDPESFHFNLHSKKYNHMKNNSKKNMVVVKESTPQFHTYGLEWSENRIRMTMDKKEVFLAVNTEKDHDAWPFNEPYFMILNLAIGGDWGGQKGVDDAIFPARYEIKSVKIYQ